MCSSDLQQTPGATVVPSKPTATDTLRLAHIQTATHARVHPPSPRSAELDPLVREQQLLRTGALSGCCRTAVFKESSRQLHGSELCCDLLTVLFSDSFHVVFIRSLIHFFVWIIFKRQACFRIPFQSSSYCILARHNLLLGLCISSEVTLYRLDLYQQMRL